MAVAKQEARKPLIRNPLRRGHRNWTVAAVAVTSIALLVTAHPTLRSVATGLPLLVAGVALRLWAASHLVKVRELTVSGHAGTHRWSFERVRGNSEFGVTLTVVLALAALTLHAL